MNDITISYWRTYGDDVSVTHLAYGQADTAICGLDLAGDDAIHSERPRRIKSRRISCGHCQAIIEAVIEHRRRLGVTPAQDEKDPDAASVKARWGG